MVSRAASSRNALCVERYALCVTRTAPRCKPRGCFFFRFFAEFGIGGVLGLGILAKETVASPRRPHRRRAMRMLRMHRMQRICSTCETALRSARARTIIFDNDLGRLLAPQLDRCAVDKASSRLVEPGVVRPHGADR